MLKHTIVNQEVNFHCKTVSELGFQNVSGQPEERFKQHGKATSMQLRVLIAPIVQCGKFAHPRLLEVMSNDSL
jgi:hypothetical protein